MRFLEKSLRSLGETLAHEESADGLSRADGLLQKLDPRAKLCGLLAMILACVSSGNLGAISGIVLFGIALAMMSKIPLAILARRIWLPVLFFTGVIALPAVFLTPGQGLFRLSGIGWEVTTNGLRTATRLIMRAETSATMAGLLVLSTPWSSVLKALRVLRTPPVFILMLGMTHRYILLLSRVADEMFEARRSRCLGSLDAPQQRRLATSGGGVLFSKSLHLGGEVWQAMQSRGFRGEAVVLDEFKMRPRDWWALAGFFSVALTAVMISSL